MQKNGYVTVKQYISFKLDLHYTHCSKSDNPPAGTAAGDISQYINLQ